MLMLIMDEGDTSAERGKLDADRRARAALSADDTPACCGCMGDGVLSFMGCMGGSGVERLLGAACGCGCSDSGCCGCGCGAGGGVRCMCVLLRLRGAALTFAGGAQLSCSSCDRLVCACACENDEAPCALGNLQQTAQGTESSGAAEPSSQRRLHSHSGAHALAVHFHPFN